MRYTIYIQNLILSAFSFSSASCEKRTEGKKKHYNFLSSTWMWWSVTLITPIHLSCRCIYYIKHRTSYTRRRCFITCLCEDCEKPVDRGPILHIHTNIIIILWYTKNTRYISFKCVYSSTLQLLCVERCYPLAILIVGIWRSSVGFYLCTTHCVVTYNRVWKSWEAQAHLYYCGEG